MKKDINKYCECMEEIKLRIAVISEIFVGKKITGRDDFDAELVFLQFRKILELIAFASIAANRQKYQRLYKDFELHWK